MKLERFRIFAEEVDREIVRKGLSFSADPFRYHAKKWYDRADIEITDVQLIEKLQKAKKYETFIQDGVKTYYYIRNLDAVVLCVRRRTPQYTTVQNTRSALQRCCRIAENAFDATHNTLTGLLNRQSFIDLITSFINPLKVFSEIVPVSSEIKADRLSLVSMDIDRFKQVNDSYTHQYGDVVLKSVAHRIETACARHSSAMTSIYSAHPSGEEFHVALVNSPDDAFVSHFCECLRTSVDNPPLPNSEELDLFARDCDVTLPSETDRHVTISLGVSHLQMATLPRDKSVDSIVTTLIAQADIALQKAKSSGRNKTIAFPDVLAKHGRVLEHDTESNVVVIDIGRYVGVRERQEFKIFDEKFRGDKPFIFNDGRTRRTWALTRKCLEAE